MLLEDAKPQALFVGWAWDRLCGLSRGRLGGHGPSDWPWKVPLGIPDRDPENGMLTNSLAGRLHDLEHWALTFGYPTPEKLERVRLTHDQAMQIDPKFTTEWDGIYDEEEASD